MPPDITDFAAGFEAGRSIAQIPGRPRIGEYLAIANRIYEAGRQKGETDAKLSPPASEERLYCISIPCDNLMCRHCAILIGGDSHPDDNHREWAAGYLDGLRQSRAALTRLLQRIEKPPSGAPENADAGSTSDVAPVPECLMVYPCEMQKCISRDCPRYHLVERDNGGYPKWQGNRQIMSADELIQPQGNFPTDREQGYKQGYDDGYEQGYDDGVAEERMRKHGTVSDDAVKRRLERAFKAGFRAGYPCGQKAASPVNDDLPPIPRFSDHPLRAKLPLTPDWYKGAFKLDCPADKCPYRATHTDDPAWVMRTVKDHIAAMHPLPPPPPAATCGLCGMRVTPTLECLLPDCPATTFPATPAGHAPGTPEDIIRRLRDDPPPDLLDRIERRLAPVSPYCYKCAGSGHYETDCDGDPADVSDEQMSAVIANAQQVVAHFTQQLTNRLMDQIGKADTPVTPAEPAEPEREPGMTNCYCSECQGRKRHGAPEPPATDAPLVSDAASNAGY